ARESRVSVAGVQRLHRGLQDQGRRDIRLLERLRQLRRAGPLALGAILGDAARDLRQRGVAGQRLEARGGAIRVDHLQQALLGRGGVGGPYLLARQWNGGGELGAAAGDGKVRQEHVRALALARDLDQDL